MKVSFDLPDDIHVLWNDANKLAKEKGIVIEGNMSNGHFSIKGININYSVSGRTLTAFADKVPFFVTEKMVKKKIQEWFNNKE
jgi:hypothetical protein